MKPWHVVVIVGMFLLGLVSVGVVMGAPVGINILPALITNGTGGAVTNTVVSYNVSSQGLFNSSYIDADAFDVDVQDGTESVGFMPGTGQVRMLACYDDAGSDETSECNDDTVDDVTLPTANSEVVEFALDNQARHLWVNTTTAAVADWTVTWEYYNGSSYVALSNVTDNTSEFTESGIKRVTWDFPAADAWVKSTLHGVHAYWVRANVSAVVSVTSPPVGGQVWYETGRWWTLAESVAASEQKQYNTHLGISETRTFHHFFPATAGVTASDAATIELTGSYVVDIAGYFDMTAPVTGTTRGVLFKDSAIEITVPSEGTIQVKIYEAP